MRKLYSQDLRDCIIDAVKKEGVSCRVVARLYKISPPTAIKWMDLYRRIERRTPSRVRGQRPSHFLARQSIEGLIGQDR